MKKSLLLLSVVLMVSAFSAGISFSAERKLECVPLIGKIMFMSSGAAEWAEMASTFEVRTGSKLRAADKCEAEIKYSDGTMLNMRSNSELEIKADGIRLNEGGIWIKLIKSKTGFKVDTPNVTIGARGTLFSVLKEANRTIVKLNEGIVDVVNKLLNTTTTLKPGQKAAIDIKGAEISISDEELEKLLGPNPFDKLTKASKELEKKFTDNNGSTSATSQNGDAEKTKAGAANKPFVVGGETSAEKGSEKEKIEVKTSPGVGTGKEKNLKEFMGR